MLVVALMLLGLGTGSFLTVVVARLHSGSNMIWGRSQCLHCKKELTWFELLPVLSFLLQGGQCRSCGQPIPRLYPAIELTLAGLFLGLGWVIQNGNLRVPDFFGSGLPGAVLLFLYYAFFAVIAVAVSAYDFRHRVIPAALIWPLAAVGFGVHAIAAVRWGGVAFLIPSLVLAAIVFAIFWSLWFFSHGRAMGRGDADVALAIALYLEPPLAIAGFLFAFWLGAIFGMISVAAKKLNWKSQIPFAPFLFSGAIIALFLAEGIVAFRRLWFFDYGF